MTEEQITFKGFPLDSRGDVIGAFPAVDVIQEIRKDLINEVVGNINQMTIDYCLKFNIDPDVLIKQKAEIELLLMKIEKMESDSKTAYIKGIRTMANALKEYDRTDGAWTDYFEHTVDKVLKNLLKE